MRVGTAAFRSPMADSRSVREPPGPVSGLPGCAGLPGLAGHVCSPPQQLLVWDGPFLLGSHRKRACLGGHPGAEQ